MITIREAAAVLVSQPVDGRRHRRATTGTRVPVDRVKVPHAAVSAALELAGRDLSRIRWVEAPEAVGGVALLVFNSKAQAATWGSQYRLQG